MLNLTLLLVPMLFLSRFSFVITLLREERELDYMFFVHLFVYLAVC